MRTIFSGEKGSVYESDEYVSGEMGNGKWVRKGNYKAVKVVAPYGNNVWELYNVENDPGETTDIAVKMPELLEELILEWEKYSNKVGVILNEN